MESIRKPHGWRRPNGRSDSGAASHDPIQEIANLAPDDFARRWSVKFVWPGDKSSCGNGFYRSAYFPPARVSEHGRYLLTGFVACGCCDGGLVVTNRPRGDGTPHDKRLSCWYYKTRGRRVCSNRWEAPMLDREIRNLTAVAAAARWTCPTS